MIESLDFMSFGDGKENFLDVDYKQIILDKEIISVTRALAARLYLSPYMTLGEFFETCSLDDIMTINDLVAKFIENEKNSNETESKDNYIIMNLAVLVSMLAKAESIYIKSLKELTGYIIVFSGLCLIAYAVKINESSFDYSNFSLEMSQEEVQDICNDILKRYEKSE